MVKEGKTVAEEQKAKYEIIYDMGTELYIEELAKLRQHDEDFVTVTEYADNTIRGTDRTKHWRIGGA